MVYNFSAEATTAASLADFYLILGLGPRSLPLLENSTALLLTSFLQGDPDTDSLGDEMKGIKESNG